MADGWTAVGIQEGLRLCRRLGRAHPNLSCLPRLSSCCPEFSIKNWTTHLSLWFVVQDRLLDPAYAVAATLH